MGRRRRFRLTWPRLKKTRKLRMFTKKQLETMARPSSYSCPDIPVKVRRSLARRAADAATRRGAHPIYFLQETSLSGLYDKNIREPYIQQVFQDVEKIGQGCFGDVFRAISKEDAFVYAIKVTNDTHSFIDLGEVRRMEKIPEHRNCVKFYFAWQECYRLYIQMEHCMTSLDKLLMVNHFIREPQCWDILADIAAGLKHLHDHELIHLDIKPANVMISADGVYKLGDFGLLVDLREVNPKTRERKRSGVSVSEGDGKYVATEVLRDGICTKGADVFSLGLLMLEVASDAVLPSSGADWEDIRDGKLPHCYNRRKLSRNYRQLINAMIRKDYTERPSITEIMYNPSMVSACAQYQMGMRINCMANWQELWQAYSESHQQLDIPVAQVEGPSPPRRSYPINYIPPISPIRVPLAELELNTPENNSGMSSLEDHRYARARRISRRLFF